MLQVTLARDNLLVGYGHTSSFDLASSHKQANAHNGCRPSVFFGPYRDAHALITRKLHGVIVLKAKQPDRNHASLVILNFPESEVVSLDKWKDVLFHNRPSGLLSWIDMTQVASEFESGADVYSQTFETKETHIAPELSRVKVTIESFVENNALREKVTIKDLDASYESYFLHWHEPEIKVSSMLQTTYVDFASSSLISYREDVWFAVQGLIDEKPAYVAFSESGELQRHRPSLGRFSELLEELLSPQDTAHPHCYVAHGHTDGLILWKMERSGFEIRYILAKSMEDVTRPFQSFAKARSSLLEADRAWVAKQKKPPQNASSHLKSTYERTLLVLRQMQDPTGGIIAAPEFQFEFTTCGGYGYCWGRDAGFISYAMDVCGMHAESAAFYRYIARCQSADGSFLHRHDMNANLGASWGFLQPDETGSVIFGLWQHIKLSKNNALAAELKETVRKGADWLAKARFHNTKLPVNGYDLWEERDGIHVYSIAAMAAGLNGAIEIFKLLGEKIPSEWTSAVNDYVDIINSSEVFGEAQMTRTLKRRLDPSLARRLLEEAGEIDTYDVPNGRIEHRMRREHVVDVSQLGVLYPYHTLDMKKCRVSFTSHVEYIARHLWRDGVGGMGRYEGDHYRNGNPWVLTTFWVSLTAAELGLTNIAKKCFAWGVKHASKEGFFSEQIDPVTGQPAWVMPLTWSHAMFALAVHELPPSIVEEV